MRAQTDLWCVKIGVDQIFDQSLDLRPGFLTDIVGHILVKYRKLFSKVFEPNK